MGIRKFDFPGEKKKHTNRDDKKKDLNREWSVMKILRFGAGWICLLVFVLLLPIWLLTSAIATLGIELAYPAVFKDLMASFKKIESGEV